MRYLFPLLLLALLVRLPLMGDGFWFDEVYSANLVTFQKTPIQLLDQVRREDAHPPLFYLLLWGWAGVWGLHGAAVGGPPPGVEWKLRSFALLWGLGVVALCFVLGRELGGLGLGLLAGGLAALHPGLVLKDTEARMYPMFTFLSLLGLYGMLHRRGAIWGPTGLALLYTHYLAPFGLLVQTLWGAWTWGRLGYLRAAALWAAYLPWLPVFWAQYQSGRDNAGIRTDPGSMAFFFIDSLGNGGNPWLGEPSLLFGVVAWGLVGLGVWRGGRPGLLLLGASLGTYLLWTLVSLKVNILSERYLPVLIPPLLILAAWGVVRLWTQGWRLLAGVALGVLVLGQALTLVPLWGRGSSEPWREMARILEGRVHPGQRVYVNEGGRAISLLYYWRPPKGVEVQSTAPQLPPLRPGDWVVVRILKGQDFLDPAARRQILAARRILEWNGVLLVRKE